MSLVWRITLIAAAVLIACLVSLHRISGSQVSRELSHALHARSEAVARSLAVQLERILHYGLPLERIVGFEEQLEEAVRSHPDVAYAAVLDGTGKAMFLYETPPARGAVGRAALQGTGVAGPGPRFLEARSPVNVPGEMHHAHVVLGYGADVVAERVAAVERRGVLVTLAVFAGGAVLLLIVLHLFVSRPIQRLDGTIRAVRRGANLAPRVEETGPREFRLLAAEFNNMLEELQAQAQALREAKQQADAANEAKSLFLAKMSHEIRTPMNGVMGMMEMLLQAGLDARQQRLAAAAMRSSEALLAIINDVLDYAKIEAGRVRIHPAPFSLQELLGDSVSILHPGATAKGLALELQLDAGLPPVLMGDAVRIRQIVWNLLSNAIKFTQRGGVTVQARSREPEGVSIRVCDTGVGMEPEVLPRVFEPFAQADESIARRFGGTGLGLTISRELVELMGGRIEAHSAPGQGTVFEVFLPLAAAETLPAPAPRQQQHLRHSGTPRVLVVDDNELNREIMEVMLEGQGLELRFVDSGPAALRELELQPFHLVLMDCRMPGMDGFEATQSWRTLEKARGLPPVPVVALTGDVSPSTRERCLAAGMDDYLTKPCPRERLLATLRQWLERGPGPRAHGPDPAPAQAVPEFDATPLNALRALQRPDMPDVLARAVELLERDSAQLVQQARHALAGRDAAALERHAHTLATMALHLGLTRAGGAARELEAMAGRTQDWSAAALQLEQLQQRLGEGVRWLKGVELA